MKYRREIRYLPRCRIVPLERKRKVCGSTDSEGVMDAAEVSAISDGPVRITVAANELFYPCLDIDTAGWLRSHESDRTAACRPHKIGYGMLLDFPAVKVRI